MTAACDQVGIDASALELPVRSPASAATRKQVVLAVDTVDAVWPVWLNELLSADLQCALKDCLIASKSC